MKLYYSPTSPYVRKVMMVAIETDLIKQIDLIPTDVWGPEVTIGQINPLGKVPTLEDDDGQLWFDSTLICQYLANYAGESEIFPAAEPDYWKALQWQILADGLCNAAVACVLEGRRPEEKRFQPWVDRQQRAITRILDRFETEISTLEGFSIGSLSVLVALGYLDLRLPALGWSTSRPQLNEWFERESQRPSFQRTHPPA